MQEKWLKHYGMPRRSGRYPWGSGKDPEQRNTSFLGYVEELRKKGLSEVEIAQGLGMKTSELRRRKTIERANRRREDHAEANRLKAKGYSNTAIGEKMGLNESSVRALLDPNIHERSEQTRVTADFLKDTLGKKNYIDVGLGVENHLGVSRTKLMSSIEMLKDEGYQVHYLQVKQAGTGKNTSLMVLTKPGVPWKEVNEHKDEIDMPVGKPVNMADNLDLGLRPIKSVDSSRIKIRYNEEGGADKDGVIELKRGVEDLDLGKSNYAQVRIGVDGEFYMKGMAMYADDKDFPDGVDVIYNTNKALGAPKEKVFKPMQRTQDGQIDKDNPFGSAIKSIEGPDGKPIFAQKGALNIVNEEGDWAEWSKTLSKQMLAKQPDTLIKQQLDLAYAIKKEEYDEIMSLTNPAVKRVLLKSFSDDCDASAVHLKAAALPRQASHAILPFPDMKENQVYAPNYKNGEQVVLIRFPHGGIFEIPQLTVNNKQPKIKGIIGNALDAIGIHPKVAEQLSGADFDGDTVLVIPTDGKKIKTSSPLKELKNFNPKASYPYYEGMAVMKPETKAIKMGDISNLITDMTIKGATPQEIAKAVKHSMVVIDAEKHKLDYKKSYVDNGIAALKKKYQGSANAGAATLLSKSKAPVRVPERKETYRIDPLTGKKIYTLTNASYVDKNGKVISRTTTSTQMAEEDDAFKLSSGSRVENIYASYANKLKAMANNARKTYVNTDPMKYSPSANKTYEPEVKSLKAKLNIALRNAPLERKAQLLANRYVQMKKQAYPDMSKATLKKIKGQAIIEARTRVGAKKVSVNVTPKEWQAIQAGAISNNVLMKVLENTNIDVIKQYAMPRITKAISPSKMQKAKAMLNSGYTQAEVAQSIGVSTSTLAKALP